VRPSLAAGRPIEMRGIQTIADGLRSNRTGAIVLPDIKSLVDDVVAVPDEQIVLAAYLLTWAKLMVEYSGATALAAVLSGSWRADGRRTAVVISGGNIDPEAVARVLDGRDLQSEDNVT